MPAKALVPVEAFPRIDCFRGHGPLLQVAQTFYARVPNSRLGGAPSVRVTMAVKALALA